MWVQAVGETQFLDDAIDQIRLGCTDKVNLLGHQLRPPLKVIEAPIEEQQGLGGGSDPEIDNHGLSHSH